MYMEKNGGRLKSIPDFLPHEMFKNPNSDCLTEQVERGWESHMILVRRWRVLSLLSLIYSMYIFGAKLGFVYCARIKNPCKVA